MGSKRNIEDYKRTQNWKLRKRIAQIQNDENTNDIADGWCFPTSNRNNIHLRDISSSSVPGTSGKENSGRFFPDKVHDEAAQNNDCSYSSTDSDLSDNLSECENMSGNENTASENDESDASSDEGSDDVNEGEAREEYIQDSLNGDVPLYDGAPLTLAESMLAILAFYLIFELSNAALDALLQLIWLHIIPSKHFKKTKHTFWKFFGGVKSPLVRHYYCGQCYNELPEQKTKCTCSDNTQNGFFIEIPIMDQLQSLYKKPGFVDLLKQRFDPFRKPAGNDVADIYDGQVYQKQTAPHKKLNNPQNISFMWYTDGAPVFKSSKVGIWPFNLIINELPYKQRISRENILLAALWVGPSHPKVNLFLRPIYDQLRELYRGVSLMIPPDNTKITVQAILLCGTADMPAKAEFLNHNNHNGYYGCLKCYSRGYSIRGDDYGNTMVHPYEGDIHAYRSHENYKEDGSIALVSGRISNGVKSSTMLTKMMPDIVAGVADDVMHNVFLGTVQKLSYLWFDSSERHKPFSLYNVRELVDARLTSIKPPSHVPRYPRSLLDHGKHWKATEWKLWFFFYSVPILHNVMDDIYFQHYLQLVNSVSILSRDCIQPDMINKAEKMLVGFVSQFQVLYGPQYMSMKIHVLLHLAQGVRDLGPTWVSTCFPFEDVNGKLLNYVHGTDKVGLQICSRLVHYSILSGFAGTLPNGSSSKQFCERMLVKGKRMNLKRGNVICNGLYILGKIKPMLRPSATITHALRNLQNYEESQNLFYFYRLKKGSQVIYARSYRRAVSFISYCVSLLSEAGQLEFGFIDIFIKICDCNMPCSVDCNARFYAIFSKMNHQTPFSASLEMTWQPSLTTVDRMCRLNYLHKLLDNNDEHPKLIEIGLIKHVCFVVNYGENTYVGEPINTFEFE